MVLTWRTWRWSMSSPCHVSSHSHHQTHLLSTGSSRSSLVIVPASHSHTYHPQDVLEASLCLGSRLYLIVILLSHSRTYHSQGLLEVPRPCHCTLSLTYLPFTRCSRSGLVIVPSHSRTCHCTLSHYQTYLPSIHIRTVVYTYTHAHFEMDLAS